MIATYAILIVSAFAPLLQLPGCCLCIVRIAFLLLSYYLDFPFVACIFLGIFICYPCIVMITHVLPTFSNICTFCCLGSVRDALFLPLYCQVSTVCLVGQITIQYNLVPFRSFKSQYQ